MKKTVFLLMVVMVTFVLFGCGPTAEPKVPSVPTDLAAAADMSAWQDAYPAQYETYNQTQKMSPTRFGGSEPMDYLEKYPFITTLYEGFGFSKMYYRSRGHYFALEDAKNTIRPKPGATCLTCKTSEYAYLLETMGDDYWSAPFDEVAATVTHTVSCLDCHDPASMENRPVRSYVTDALTRAGLTEVTGNLVCAQCHVEYYFGSNREVILPWDNGLEIEDIERYFDERGFSDWTHPRTGTPLIKIQHPEYELYKGSVHDSIGLTCVSCHMPETNGENGSFKSHWLTSPLNHLEASCASCHADTTAIHARVEGIQETVYKKKRDVGEKLAEAIDALAAAVEANADEEIVSQGRALHRSAQLYWDWVFVENSSGFHNGAEANRVLDKAADTVEELLALLQNYR